MRFLVGDVLRVLEGSLEAVERAGNEDSGGCTGADLCVAKYVWKRINDSITQAVGRHDGSICESIKVQEKNQGQQRGNGVICPNSRTKNEE